ncbi:MAG: YesL family protein [Clostridia bacterium]|nr:YesL family protein [Clostridia bacterium]
MFRRKIKEEKKAPPSVFERPMWRFFGSLGDFFILTVYWVLTSLPVVTIGASTTALFYVCFRMHNGEDGKRWQMYRKSFKENLKQATFIWLLYIFVALDVFIIGHTLCQMGVLSAADFKQDGKLYASLVIVILTYLSVMLYTAGSLAMFRQSTGQCIQGAVIMTFAQLPSTLLYLVILLALWLFTYYIFPAAVFIDVPLAIYWISARMNRIFQKQIARVEADKTKIEEPGEENIEE